ncbi:MAG: glycosyltransferase [Candidatus Jorgensenbacteria bacterium]
MKILHVAPSYLPAYRYGGPILSVHSMNKWLARAGVDVTVYTTNVDGKGTLDVPLGREILVDGVKVWYFPVSFPRAWTYSRELRRALNKNVGNFDVVHITSVFLAASTLGARAALRHKKPYIISPRGSLMKEPLSMRSAWKKKIYIFLVERRNLGNAAAVHFTTEKEKEEYIAAGFPMKKSIVIPNAYEESGKEKEMGTQVNVRKKLNIPEGVPIVLSLGRINWKKGFDTLIPAFKKVKETFPQSVLVVAGGDEEGYRDEVERLASEEGMKINTDIKFTDGMVLGAEKAALLEAATVFALPSYSENFGMAPIESMAHGTAVVVTRNIGIATDIEKAGAGVVVEEKTVENNRKEEFADAVVKVLQEEGVEKRMGARARAFVAEAYAPARVAERFAGLYNQVVKK